MVSVVVEGTGEEGTQHNIENKKMINTHFGGRGKGYTTLFLGT